MSHGERYNVSSKCEKEVFSMIFVGKFVSRSVNQVQFEKESSELSWFYLKICASSSTNSSHVFCTGTNRHWHQYAPAQTPTDTELMKLQQHQSTRVLVGSSTEILSSTANTIKKNLVMKNFVFRIFYFKPKYCFNKKR